MKMLMSKADRPLGLRTNVAGVPRKVRLEPNVLLTVDDDVHEALMKERAVQRLMDAGILLDTKKAGEELKRATAAKKPDALKPGTKKAGGKDVKVEEKGIEEVDTGAPETKTGKKG